MKSGISYGGITAINFYHASAGHSVDIVKSGAINSTI